MTQREAGFSLLELDRLQKLDTIHSELYGSDDEIDSPSPQPTDSQPTDSINEINSIQQQLSKWLSKYETEVTKQEFTSLMKKIAPFVTEKEMQQLFHQIDFQNIGCINKQVLLQNNYLANLIMRLYSKSRYQLIQNHNDDDDQKVATSQTSQANLLVFGDINLELENEKLKTENLRLKKWINDIGRPLEIKAQKLENQIKIYRDETQTASVQIENLKLERDSLINLQKQLHELHSHTNTLTKDNEHLKRLHLENNKSLQVEHNKLEIAMKKIQSIDKLNKELTQINDQYKKVNQELNESKEKYNEEIQNLRCTVIEQQLQIQHLLQDKQENNNSLKQENDALKQQVAEKEAQIINEQDNCLSPSGINHGVEHTLQLSVAGNLFNDISSLQIPSLQIPSQSGTMRITQRLSGLYPGFGGLSTPVGLATPVGYHNNEESIQFIHRNTLSPDISQITISPPNNNGSSTNNGLLNNAPYSISTNDKKVNDEQQQQQTQNMLEFVDESVRKEIELETRQAVKQEFINRFEIDAQQIRVDAHIERQKEKAIYNEEISQLRDDFQKYKDKNQSKESKYRKKINELQKELDLLRMNKDNDDDDSDDDDDSEDGDIINNQERKRKRTKRVHKTNDDTCYANTTCTLPQLKKLLFGTKKNNKPKQ